ncbi:NADH-quinone oxidoreductase subunit G [Actinobacteria bacterium YIM 96077]|uniref:NADH-quinone oxidoreductase n=1 Tax=Phytoactinopolyspora halophila TaxID=1981511 RepID=A0A329QQS7_9ACTN|nr:NADH-quinone oxidoreductase subunit G [Phytoactinopolyspora halophila]AYY14784.1 NADH-quinone oxidoreductase subunit G [Actinobacteria bacterium YIM 96077]RAW13058.1 NADH-quinone oxidoreductase subunit G [Phytoactinopolyspora halophila]
MTVTGKTTTTDSTSDGAVEQKENLVTLTIDGFEVSVPEGTLVIRAAEMIGIQIPRFCDHPLLEPAGACRQCLVEVPDMGNGRAMPKPQASCTLTVMPGMVVKTQLTSRVADKAQQGIMEFLLMNHPLDCPVCDKGGECPLQNQAMSNGRGDSRYEGKKRTFPKPINISAQILLDRERCVLCARCTRFSQEIAGDPFIEMLERGALQQVGIYEKEPFESYFSGNTIQICPVGALTSAAYRFRSRPFDLVSVPSVAEHDACGSAIRVDHRRGTVMRRLSGDDPEVNEEWITDKDRFAFRSFTLDDRLTHPLVRDEETGELEAASWREALTLAARGLAAARDAKGVGVLTGGRVTLEDAYAYAKFARIGLGTNDIDFRARAHSAEEAAFLQRIATTRPGDDDAVTFSGLESAPAVMLAGFEPEEEAGTVFLRLRKAMRRGTKVFSIAPFATRGLQKLSGQLLPTVPGAETQALDAVAAGSGAMSGVHGELSAPGSVLLVGERLASVPGGLTAATRLAEATGARLAWIPRRAGDRGAIEAGAMPHLLPGGRPIDDAEARVDMTAAWGVPSLPPLPGRDTDGIVSALAEGSLSGAVVGGVELTDLPDPAAARSALERAGFVLSLEVRRSDVTDLADIVLPVAPPVEKAGTFVNWEGRHRPFPKVMQESAAWSDARALDAVASELDIDLGTRDVAGIRAELDEIGTWRAAPTPLDIRSDVPPEPGANEAVLATWRTMLDAARGQDGEPHLAQTAPAPRARLSAATAAELGIADGEPLTVSTVSGAVTLPLAITEMPDRVVWVPQNSPGSRVHADLGVGAGAVVTLAAAGETGDESSDDLAGGDA